MSRTIDRTKKSNIKCEHCEHFAKDPNYLSRFENPIPFCLLTGEDKNYWNRCKQFKWKERNNVRI